MSFYNWIPKDEPSSWQVHKEDDVRSRISSISSTSVLSTSSIPSVASIHAEEHESRLSMTLKLSESSKPLREMNCQKNEQLDLTSGRMNLLKIERNGNGKNGNGKYVHVPHRDKPPQVVAKRNARERRRVHAVNSAFVRLRKAVPFDNNRGKRISKVKTLQYAIDYIHNLQELLNDYNCQNIHYCYDYYQAETEQQTYEYSNPSRFDGLNYQTSLPKEDFDMNINY